MNSDATAIAYQVQREQEWTDAALLDVVLDYIANQDSDAAFRDHLTELSADAADTADQRRDLAAEVNANLAAVGEEIQRACRPPSRPALWLAGYDAGKRDTQLALGAGQRQTSLNWHRPDDTLPADLAARCEWLRGYSASIRAAIADASHGGKFTPGEAVAEAALATIVARFQAEEAQQPTLRALTHHRSGYKITIERAD